MSTMRNNISHRLLYVVLFISLLLVVYFTSTTAFYLPPAPTTRGVGKCIDNERHALLDFKASIDRDPEGLLSTWRTHEEATNDCCEWFGVTCSNQTGHITGLYLSFGNLQVENLDWLSRMTKLEELRMNDVFMGKADNWVNSSSSSSIFDLDLGNNNLNSSLYNWLFPLTSNIKLESLVLGGNKLDMIPKYFGNLCSLKHFSFSSNTMPISFPNFLKNLSGCTLFNLTYLDLYNSQFTGSLSNDIQNFSSLNFLQLSNNRLNGTISEKVWQLPKLQALDVSSNSLQGGISKNIRNSKIWFIDVSNNSLQEVDSEAYMSKVAIIDMSSNNIYGTIPNISSTVIWLNLSKNRLYGGLSFLCGHVVNPDLYYLDLSNNSLTGKIPDCLWHFKELQILNLGYNKLFGKIPSSVHFLKNLQKLYLNNNNFSGQLPLSLGSCTKLILIDLGANGFSGSVPFWIGEKLSSLYALSLTSNNFSRTIPSQICQLANLQLLDLSKNNLHGTIPPCLGLCGLPLSKYCPGDKELQLPPILGENNGDDDKENIWFYIGGAIGFAIGF
ncbi:hypothetical protein E3N88_16535 [Mikania micrantha]|uniref:Leucine-rich repeat-containing N-terminal plant-type domain-containing protein n=1 Tax=Mikania micrantha TaxID=192012 RepID=A0A5N6P1S3_9ASTR|nr:hypothetical protein E3N88_16535 [Mikania micrantha]